MACKVPALPSSPGRPLDSVSGCGSRHHQFVSLCTSCYAVRMATPVYPKGFQMARTHLVMVDPWSMEIVTPECKPTMVFQIRQQTSMCLVATVGLSKY